MQRLAATTTLPPGIRRPAYDRSALEAGIVHLGLGAFHRAHQAIYTDDALEAEFGPWGIVGVSPRSTDIARALAAQDCLSSVTSRDASGDEVRVIGSVVETIAAAAEPERLLARLVSPAIRIVSLTVSEKAYGLDPATGGLDRRHPAVAADLADPARPSGAVGTLVAGLARRRAAGLPPYTVLCCDNLPANGRVVRRLVLEMAGLLDPALAAWIEAEGRFPSTMVDRIVPAATDETRERAARHLGAEDVLAIETEPFSQWVIEDDFVSGRPAWDRGGALFVTDVEPYERMKLRLLNGSHSLIAYLGQIHGLDFVRDVMAAPEHAERVRRHMAAAAATLGPVPGVDLAAYGDRLLARFANPRIAHRTAQIAMDGSQKMPQRIFQPALDHLAAGGDAAAFADAAALWLAYLLATPTPNDPRAAELRAAAEDSLAAGVSSRPFTAVDGLFPAALAANGSWTRLLDERMKAWSAVSLARLGARSG